MEYLNDSFWFGFFFPNIYLAVNVKDFIDSIPDLPNPGLLKRLSPIVQIIKSSGQSPDEASIFLRNANIEQRGGNRYLISDLSGRLSVEIPDKGILFREEDEDFYKERIDNPEDGRYYHIELSHSPKVNRTFLYALVKFGPEQAETSRQEFGFRRLTPIPIRIR